MKKNGNSMSKYNNINKINNFFYYLFELTKNLNINNIINYLIF